MSISSVSPNYSTYQPSNTRSNFREMRQEFQNLASALQSGDLAGAKDAFSTLQQAMQGFQRGGASAAQGGSKTQNQFGADLAAIAKALQSGDSGAAQDALKKLLEEMQAAAGGHRPQAQGAQAALNAYVPSETKAASAATGNGVGGTARIDTTA